MRNKAIWRPIGVKEGGMFPPPHLTVPESIRETLTTAMCLVYSKQQHLCFCHCILVHVGLSDRWQKS